jgi:hypothetical protein
LAKLEKKRRDAVALQDYTKAQEAKDAIDALWRQASAHRTNKAMAAKCYNLNQTANTLGAWAEELRQKSNTLIKKLEEQKKQVGKKKWEELKNSTNKWEEFKTSSGRMNISVEAIKKAVQHVNETLNEYEAAQRDYNASREESYNCTKKLQELAKVTTTTTTGMKLVPLPNYTANDTMKEQWAKIAAYRKTVENDCVVGSWGPWSGCHAIADDGMKAMFQTRTRPVVTPVGPGGKSCPSTKQRQTCRFEREAAGYSPFGIFDMGSWDGRMGT